MKRPARPRRRTVVQFVFFNTGGAVFFIVGYALFAVLYGVFHWPWLPAKIVADSAGWCCNFAIQYFVAFREERRGHRPHIVAGKFTIISLLNLAIDYGIVGVLKWLGVSPFIGLIVASQFFTVWKWFWYRTWVFKKLEKPEA